MRRILFIAPALLLVGATLVRPDPIRKCGSGQKPLYAVDGVITELDTEVEDQLQRVDMTGSLTNRIMEIQVVCMNPQDSTFNRSRGIPVISIWTHDGPVGRIEPALEAILAAQDEHHRRTARYLDSLEGLELDAPEQIHFTLELRDDGWIAEAVLQRYLHRCLVWDGESPPFHGYVARRPSCLRI